MPCQRRCVVGRTHLLAVRPEDSLYRAPLLSQGLQARSETSARNLNRTATDVFLGGVRWSAVQQSIQPA